MYEELLEGTYDLHVHPGPDVSPRKLDDLEYAERARKLGIKGFGIKSHYFCTAERARLVHKLYPDVHPLGAVVLNNAVGGINPAAVEMAARDGAKLVWMPTFDSENEIQYLFNNTGYEELPPWAKVQLERKEQGKAQAGLSVLEEGVISPKTHEVLDLIAENNMVLSTGHLSKVEIFELVKSAREHKITKILVTHPTFSSIALSKEEQKQLVELGAMMDECYGCITPGYGTTWENIYEQIRFLGPENCVLSSDLGQVNNPYPDEGLVMFVTNLIQNGFTKTEITTMTAVNTSLLAEE
ncbi:DUF6282 family protein [Alicyclobacillus sp. ALC3]|uniref:DUF6282 family protein n=1 Tax=Alicyclobacillus sp. ALC3 TaxID=2796143 RepID=UPI0023795CD8|nr:DUF6282 family protein [Alicyclobacillus sp. ALC3]WDL97754.1 cytosolic protein [Alicyclobacillus sp. ALC3]